MTYPGLCIISYLCLQNNLFLKMDINIELKMFSNKKKKPRMLFLTGSESIVVLTETVATLHVMLQFWWYCTSDVAYVKRLKVISCNMQKTLGGSLSCPDGQLDSSSV